MKKKCKFTNLILVIALATVFSSCSFFGIGAPADNVSTEKDITTFFIGSATGVITGTDIAITVPFGTDVTSLVAVLRQQAPR